MHCRYYKFLYRHFATPVTGSLLCFILIFWILQETLYHIAASCLYFASALYLLIYLTNKTYRDSYYVAKTAASVSNHQCWEYYSFPLVLVEDKPFMDLLHESLHHPTLLMTERHFAPVIIFCMNLML